MTRTRTRSSPSLELALDLGLGQGRVHDSLSVTLTLGLRHALLNHSIGFQTSPRHSEVIQIPSHRLSMTGRCERKPYVSVCGGRYLSNYPLHRLRLQLRWFSHNYYKSKYYIQYIIRIVLHSNFIFFMLQK